jgi:HemY protein
MRSVVWLILLFTVAVVAASALGHNDGIVTLAWSGWRAELSMNLFVVLFIAACFMMVAVLRALQALTSLPQRASEWRELQRERAAQAALREAQAEYFAARYGRAQKAAQRAMAIHDDTVDPQVHAESHLLAQLIAAASLHRLQDKPRREELVNRIDASWRGKAPRSGTARAALEGASLMNAEWAIDDRDADKALQLLAEMPPGVARRTQAMRLRLRAARMAQRPLDALNTARLLAKHQAFSETAARGLLRTLAGEALDSAHDADQLRRCWLDLDAADRRDPQVASRAARRAAALGATGDARAWLAPFWDDIRDLTGQDREAVSVALSESVAGIGADWLPRVEAAVNALPREAAVAAAAGVVLAERQLWGKARRLLEQGAASHAVDVALRRRAWRQLATLARNEGDEARASACDRSAAQAD